MPIRPIRKEDKDQWLQLWCAPQDSYLAFYKALHKVLPETTECTFQRFLDESEPVYAAVATDDNGTLVGFMTYLTHRNTWDIKDAMYINDLFVSEKNRLAGTGRSLFEFVYAEADKLGVGKVYWNTQFENHRAQLLYTKVGVKSGFLLYLRPPKSE